MRNILALVLMAILGFFAWSSYSKDPAIQPGHIPALVENEPADEDLITISPETILPGDPIMILVTATSAPASVSFDGKNFPIFSYNRKFGAFVPVDFNEKDLEHEAKVVFSNGTAVSKLIAITLREKIEKPLGIPEKLGGNTPAAEKELVNNLAKENAVLNAVKTEPTQLWKESFHFPLENIFITDNYGYDRKTVNSTIVHKGTDFRAAEGTEVRALNDGVVRVARIFTVYGTTVVVDHGQGVQSFYMHLSKLDVKEGDSVKTGQIVGLSGKTGYAEAAHLHITIKINGISIDPMTFLEFFNVI